jgi:transcription-repair coupling factor (superfamily II helicase)
VSDPVETGKLALWTPLLGAELFRRLERRLREGERGQAVAGLVESARALLLGLLAERGGRPLLLVLPDDGALEARRRDLSAVAALIGRDPKRIVALPALDADPWNAIPPHPEVVRERVVALDRLARGQVDLLLVPARGLLSLLPSPEEWDRWTRTIRVGDNLPPERFVLQALGLGYRRVDIVSAPGEVSRRGGIVDIFPPAADEPVRIELFGDTVDSLRAFDTDHQRSTGKLDEIVVGPALESPPTEQALHRVERRLRDRQQRARGDERAARRFRELLDALEHEGCWPGFETLAAMTAERPALLFDHAREMLLVVDEPEAVEQALLQADHDMRRAWEESDIRALPPPSELYADAGRVRDELRRAHLMLQELAGESPGGAASVETVPCRAAMSYAGRIADLAEDLRRPGAEATRTVCVMRAQGSAARLKEILGGYDLHLTDWEAATPAPGSDPWQPGGLFVAVAGLRNGFELPGAGLVVLTERDLFGEERKRRERKGKRAAAFLSDFRDLETGSLVVHVDHGVARYTGLGRPKGGSLNRDFMVLEFSGGDRLFVPVDRLDLVQKYSGVAGKEPALDRLGGPGWERVKSRVRRSVESMAKELLELYARRGAAVGHAFTADTHWQRDLESAFPFELTPDQQSAVDDVKRDMESTRVMDRLLVGDVGYGKTEVAVRAAFKAVMDGKQVALLAPTTVLAVQHFETFRQRYAPFPVRIEMVSRFRTAGQVRKVLQDLELGAVDVLIGTHRMLSRDVTFKELGLLVVDEEQRFGVRHKERLKRLAIGVDVLSMTATPIPRTLQMSLAGVRDLSIIETPPPGRMAIQTYVIPFRMNVLAQALRQELRRGGQVFVVHNRIETLPALTRAIGEMVPEARIVTAHGKLPERKLEELMLKFTHHEADILVTTTIIENGLDIPRANTIIVNRADRFGLAQLYQLRGRVGRSHEHAYAYLLVPSRHSLSTEARQRLRAVQEFSELGAGFRLAAADLEIRGAGELLGARQHGHIAALGFDMYCQILERTVAEVRGEPVVERKPANLHLGVDIKIPEHYLPESADRLVVYKRLAQAASEADVDRLQAETEDRFGHLPQPARNLFDLGRLRLTAEAAGVTSVDLAEGRLQIRFGESAAVDPQRIVEMVARERGKLTPSGMLSLPAPPRGADRIQSVAALFERILHSGAKNVAGSS